MDLKSYLSDRAALVDAAMNAYLPPVKESGCARCYALLRRKHAVVRRRMPLLRPVRLS